MSINGDSQTIPNLDCLAVGVKRNRLPGRTRFTNLNPSTPKGGLLTRTATFSIPKFSHQSKEADQFPRGLIGQLPLIFKPLSGLFRRQGGTMNRTTAIWKFAIHNRLDG